MKMNLIPKYITNKYILFLKCSFFIILNIIICIFIFKNFCYINNKCDIIIISNIFYFIIIFFFLLFINLFYVLLTNLCEKKTFNLCLTILTISTLIILILTLCLKNKVEVSKLSEIFYNIFLQIKVIKIVWNQQELMTIGQQYVIEKSFKISQEIIFNLTTEVKNPEQLIEKLNLIYINTLKETTILDKTLNFLQDHKFKILIGTGVTILGIVGVTYILPILISKFAVAPIIEAVQENPIIEIGVQENPSIEMGDLTVEAFKLLDGDEQTKIIELNLTIKRLISLFRLQLAEFKTIEEQVHFLLKLEKNVFRAFNCRGNLKITKNGFEFYTEQMGYLDKIDADIPDVVAGLLKIITG